uniref:Uncharacterized protein n=1 Tax=Aquisalinus luteolus TaxID=1566827 RepID=A0A8J3A4B8_9PROT|nr:hypothetical protein GCM10011355_33320 [Aquisalinus luteolus]
MCQDEMGRGGDRDEFRQALDDGEDDQLKDGHGRILLFGFYLVVGLLQAGAGTLAIPDGIIMALAGFLRGWMTRQRDLSR